MLRCPPSRITLGAADLYEADSRIRARRAARIALFNEANVRLSPGPGRSIRHSTVTEKHHAGTLSGADHSHPSAAFCFAESHECKDEAEAGRPSNPEVTSAQHTLRFADSTLDGVVDVQPATCPSHCRNQSSKVDLAERIPDADKLHGLNNSSSPPPGLPTRRHHGSSQTFVVHDDPDELQELIRHRHLDRLPSGEFHPDIPPPVPELVLTTPRVATNLLALDPGAPVFVPRIRLGNTTCPSEEDPTVDWESFDSTRNSCHLRLRTSSEQNAEQHNTRQENDTQLRARNLSDNDNQNAFTQDNLPILERYPLLRPARQTASGRNSISQRSAQITRRRATRLPSTASLQHLAASRQASINHRSHPAVATGHSQSDNGDDEIPTPIIQPRSSSLAWGRTITPPTNTQPSTVDGSSSFGSVPPLRAHSAEHRWDATTEFLNMRRSPLDELTETLSRLSAARPRSVGRSWEKPPNSQNRISLLSGDLFRHDSSPSLSDSLLPSTAQRLPTTEPTQVMRMQIAAQVTPEVPLSLDDLATLPRVPPHSSPIPVPSPELPSTPPRAPISSSSPRKPLDQRSPAKPKEALTPGSAIWRKPVPGAGATPKVKVYNDSEPPDTQPQTPADVLRTARKSKRGRSDDLAQSQVDPSDANRMNDPSPTLTSQQVTYHGTFPSMFPARTLSSHVRQYPEISVATTRVLEPTRNEHVQRRADSARNTLDRENDEVEGHLQGLEEDRRVWMARREGGSLDTTPPAEGRYERYLS